MNKVISWVTALKHKGHETGGQADTVTQLMQTIPFKNRCYAQYYTPDETHMKPFFSGDTNTAFCKGQAVQMYLADFLFYF